MPDLITPLQLRNYSIEELSLTANKAYQFRKVSPEPSVNMDFEYIPLQSENGYQEFSIRLILDVNKSASDFAAGQYKIHFSIRTFFQLSMDADESDRYEKILIPNGLAMSYSIARGIVGQLTGMGESGAFILPTVNMHLVIGKKIQALERAKKRQNRPGT
jgi:preprotein translocase subunit SecB